jgi:AraC-type transcriptional regulator
MLPNTGSEPSRGVVGGDSRSSSRAWRRPGRGRGERWPCTGALDSLENRIPFVAMGRLLHECAVHTGCQHFALLVGQRTHLSHLGLPGQLARHSPTVGAALRTFAVYQHLNNQGMATFLLEKDGVATLGAVVYQKGAEHVDQIYDVNIAATLSIMRELYVAHWRPDRVLFSHPRPVDAGFYRRAFQAPCQFNAERTALVFPASVLDHRLASADAEQLRILEAQAHARDDFGVAFRLSPQKPIKPSISPRAEPLVPRSRRSPGRLVKRNPNLIRFGATQHLAAAGDTLAGRWNCEQACELLRSVLVEIEALAEQFPPARTGALLDEFEADIGHAFLGQDLRAVKALCELYERRFRALAGQE